MRSESADNFGGTLEGANRSLLGALLCDRSQYGWTLLLLVQRLAKVGVPGLVNSITAVAYHFCPILTTALTQPGAAT